MYSSYYAYHFTPLTGLNMISASLATKSVEQLILFERKNYIFSFNRVLQKTLKLLLINAIKILLDTFRVCICLYEDTKISS